MGLLRYQATVSDEVDATGAELPPGELQMRDRLRARLFGMPCEPQMRGRYVVLGVIGRGGLGVVHAAYDPELDRKVAIKVLRQQAPGAARLRERLRREAVALARLSHPNVVAVHDLGDDGEELWIAMALVDGCTLRAWLDAQPRSWRAVRDVLVGVASGLAAAHRVGLVHRDIKPGNIMIASDGRPLVLDFGLARQVDGIDAPPPAAAPRLGDGDLTDAGTLLGTPAYMAPEQLRGGVIDARTDQWGLCVTAYECLYGARPFVAEGIEQLRRQVEGGPPPAPARGVPRWLHRAIERGLAVDPAGRHADMDALVWALHHDRRSRRRQWWALAAALLLAIASAGIAALVVGSATDPRLLIRIAMLERQAQEAAAAQRFVVPTPASPGATTALQAVVALERIDTRDARSRARALRASFATALAARGDAYWELPGGRGYAADFYAAAALFEPERPEPRARALRTDGELAVLRDQALRGEFTDAELEQGQLLTTLATASDPPRALTDARARQAAVDRLPALTRPLALADAPPLTPTPSPAAVADPSSRPTSMLTDSAAPAAASDDGETTARTRASASVSAKAGWSALRGGDDREAETAFHRALAADPRQASALRGLAEIHFDRGEYQRALDYATKACRAAPRDPRAHMQHGDVAFKVLHYDEARRAYERAQALGDPDAARALARLAALQGG